MSATQITRRRQRLQRSALAVPATSERFFAKAAASDADAIFLDLEDAIAETHKDKARVLAIEAINTLDWGSKVLSVRVNGLDTRWALKDIVEVATHCPRLDMILLPKAGTAFDVQFVAHVLTLVEREQGRANPIGIEALIETSLGVANVEAIAASSDRLEALIFGIADYTADMRTYDMVAGTSTERYSVLTNPDAQGTRHRHWNDQWHFAMARIANACRAYGLRPIDGPFTHFSDSQGFAASAQRAAALGFEGKWAIHPDQIAGANVAFSPTPEQVAWSTRIVKAIERSLAEGQGAFSDDGVLIDMVHTRLARSLQERVQLIESATTQKL